MSRDVIYMARSQRTIDGWPAGIQEMVKTNLQALQSSQANSFCDLPDWINQGKTTDKKLKGDRLKGSRQFTIKDGDSFRVVYVAEFKDKIVVLHAFKKKVEGVQQAAMKTVEQRLKTLRADIKAGLI